MKLQAVEIKNFRSIASFELSFPHGCQVLIGINESGKSNILKALQLLDPATAIAPSDLRIERQDEAEISTGLVRFKFELNPNEIYSTLSNKFESGSIDKPLIQDGEKQLTLKEFCEIRCKGLHDINLVKASRSTTYWSLPEKKYKVIDGWRMYKNSEELSLVDLNDKVIVLKNSQIFQSNLLKISEDLVAEVVTPDQVNDAIGAEVVKRIKNDLPKCVYWTYSDQYLLPSSIDIDAFIANPDICIPLKNMFELAGYKGEKIGETITTARQQQAHRYLNLLTRVSNAATKHLLSVWKDHKGIKIELRANGTTLIPIVQDDQVPMDMANRSDGFKRLVSFLLQISAKVNTSQLKNALILIDEPEIALHPRGAKNLMRELISIGQTNSVVYSTHSIFMVDRENIDRHIIVEKKNEVTTTWRADKSRIQDEDVLYGAIGYSIFETVNKKNVIFEGWRDKELFRVVRDAQIKSNKLLKFEFESVGLTFAEGVKDVKHVSKFLELANRNCLIISDGDGAGISGQNEHTRSHGWGKWVTLNDIYGPGTKMSIEDLMTQASVIKRSNQFRKNYAALAELNSMDFKQGDSTIKTLDTWIKTLALSTEDHKEAMHELKNHLFEKLKREDVRDEAEQLTSFVLAHDFSIV
jgi:energy-coupling factor transporter ATP-binding protein EcfA2